MDEEQDDNLDEWLIAWALLLLLLNGNANAVLTVTQRLRARTLLRANYEQTVQGLANSVSGGTMALATWTDEMQLAYGGYARQMAVAGAGTLPDDAMRAVVDTRIREQEPFLARFARLVAAGALSVRAIAARAKLYGNVGHAAYWQAQGSSAQTGYIERWISQDDQHVCINCAPLHNRTFLPGQGTMPGEVCLGICRCSRVLEYNPDEYRRLSGQRRAA
jgi:hypothetical protein